MLLYCVQDMTLTLYCHLFNHVKEKLLSFPTTWNVTRSLKSTMSPLQTHVNLCCPLLTNYLATWAKTNSGKPEKIYCQIRSVQQINHKSITWQRVEKWVKSCTSMMTVKVILTNRQHSDQQQYIGEDLPLVTQKGTPLSDSKNHSYHLMTPSIAH